jgi:SAM-dependent methyltransferase
LGVSDRPYFAWLRAALARYEAGSGHLSALGRERSPLDLWVLAGARTNPGIEFVRATLGSDHTALRFLDRFADDPGVERVDFNDLKGVPDDACDVLVMSRASYMIAAAEEFLDHARRIVRPGGLAVVDWLHGRAEAPALDLPGMYDYGGHHAWFVTTYCDPEFIAEFPREFDSFLRHVNRPPSWVNLEDPGRPLSLGRRVERLLAFRRQAPEITRANCLDAMRMALSRAGKRLIEPETLAHYFTVLFREARYFYRLSGKFHLYLLTVLRPVGK